MKNLKYFLSDALKNNYALGAFNFSNMECLQGILQACKTNNSPAIVSVSEGAFKYMGDNFTMALAKAAKEEFPYLFLHLDHGKSFEICQKAINLGFDSVMIDGSSLNFEENIALTKKVVLYAHSKNVLVEGELGQIKGIEDNVSSESHFYTNPLDAQNFVKQTNVDFLAISIGTSHGAYKYSGEQTLRIDILSEIEKTLPDFPLVLHGASQVPEQLLEKVNKFGGEIKGAKGIPANLLEEVVTKHNIVKINTDTDIRLSMTGAVRECLTDKSVFDPRHYLGKGVSEIASTVENKIKNVLFSNNRI